MATSNNNGIGTNQFSFASDQRETASPAEYAGPARSNAFESGENGQS